MAHIRLTLLALLLVLPIVAWGYDATSMQRDQATSLALIESLSLAEWMGPLAPIALSPFFGLMCLSGASLLMDQGLLPAHPMIEGNAALNHEGIFLTLLVLTLITSLPRLTKVSKPLTQVADFLETYAGIVMILVVQYIGMKAAAEPGPTAAIAHAGFIDTASFGLIAFITAINILVIQTVRLFFELLILLSPIPFLDALFETANKTVCLALTAVYLFHPAAALVLNLILFGCCLLIVRGVHRKMVKLRNEILLPMIRRIFFPAKG